ISWLISARFRHYQLLAPMAREVLRDSSVCGRQRPSLPLLPAPSKTVTACSHGPVGRPEVSKLKLRWDRPPASAYYGAAGRPVATTYEPLQRKFRGSSTALRKRRR